jgi:two-component sensor histidine kinase
MRAAFERTTWDAVLSDLSLPRFSAAAALAILRERSPDMPFIIVSGTVGEEAAVEAMRFGASDYVLKDALGRLTFAVERSMREAKERAARRQAEKALQEVEARRLAELERLGQLRTQNDELEARVSQRTGELLATLNEREVLLQEIHHRVKNNLQLISSLISMQVRRLADPASRNALSECRNRVGAMALIHDQLYQFSDYARIPFAEYARKLAGNVLRAMGISPANVSLKVLVEDISLPVGQAIPCGLILNELITNALKHGLRDGQKGTIGLELAGVGEMVRLAVWDDGVGIPAETDVRKSQSLGMQLVFMLSEQLEGTVEVRVENGTRFEVTFPKSAGTPV